MAGIKHLIYHIFNAFGSAFAESHEVSMVDQQDLIKE